MNESWDGELDQVEMPDDLRESIKPELEPGERLLWASKSGLRSRRGGMGGRGGALVWAGGFFLLGVVCSVAFPFAVAANRKELDSVLLICGVFSGIISFLIVVGVLSNIVSSGTQRKKLAGNVYALTDRRAMIWVTDPSSSGVSVHTYLKGSIKPELVRRVQYPDGTGDVLFREAYQEPPGFIDVDDVRRVELLFRRYLVATGPESTP